MASFMIPIGHETYDCSYMHPLKRRVNNEKKSCNQSVLNPILILAKYFGIEKLDIFNVFNKFKFFKFQKKKYPLKHSEVNNKFQKVIPAYNAILGKKPIWTPIIHTGSIKMPAIIKRKENLMLKKFIEYEDMIRNSSSDSSHSNYCVNEMQRGQEIKFYNKKKGLKNSNSNYYSGSSIQGTIKDKENYNNSKFMKNFNYNHPIDKKIRSSSENYEHFEQNNRFNNQNERSNINPHFFRGNKFSNQFYNNSMYEETASEFGYEADEKSSCSSWSDFSSYLPQPENKKHLISPILANKFHPGFNYAPMFKYHYNYYETNSYIDAFNNDSKCLENNEFTDESNSYLVKPLTTSRDRLQSGSSYIEKIYE